MSCSYLELPGMEAMVSARSVPQMDELAHTYRMHRMEGR